MAGLQVYRAHTNGTADVSPTWESWPADADQPTDCIIYIWAHNDGGGTPLSITESHASDPDLGWVELHGPAPSNSGTRTAFWYRRRKTTAISEPTISGASDEWVCYAEVLPGIDTTTAIDVSAVTNQTSGTSTPTAPAVTTTVANAIVRRFVGCDGSAVAPVPRERFGSYFLVGGANDNPASASGTAGVVITAQVQESAGDTGTFRFGLGAADGGRQMTVAFKPASGAAVPGYCKTLGSDPEVAFPFPIASFYNSATDLSTLISTLDGETVQAGTASLTNSGGVASTAQLEAGFIGGFTVLRCSQAATPSGPAGYYGSRATLVNGPVDWENKLYIAIARIDANNQRATDTPIQLFWDSSGNYAAVRVASRVVYNGFAMHVCRLPDLSVIQSAGTIDWSDITQIGFAKYATNNGLASARNQDFGIKYLMAVDPGSVLASLHGSLTLDVIEQLLKSLGCGTVAGQIQGGVQLLSRFGFQVGDGGTGVASFDGEGASLAFPSPSSGYAVEDNDIKVKFLLGASDEVSLSAMALVSQGADVDFEIDSTSDDSSLTGSAAVLIGQSLDLQNSQPLTSTTVIGSPKAACYGSTLTDCTIKSTSASDAAANWSANGGGFVGGTIDLTGVTCQHHIELGTSVTDFDLSNAQLLGSAGTSNIEVLRTTGTVTISLAAGQSDPTYTSAGATVEFDKPQNTALVSISVTGAMVEVYNVDTATVVQRGIVAGTSWSLSYDEGTTFTSGDTVRVRVAHVVGASAYEPEEYTAIASASGWSVSATLSTTKTQAAAYNTWAIDGTAITKYSQDGTNFDIDIVSGTTGTKKELAAWWMAQLMTVSGIRDFWGALTIEGVASIRQNVSVVDTLIQNTVAGTSFVFTDNDVRYYRSDYSSPYDVSPSYGSIFMDYSGVPLTVETGTSGLTPTEAAQLGLIEDVKDLVEADEIHSATTIEKRLRGTATVLLTKNHSGTPLSTFQAVDP